MALVQAKRIFSRCREFWLRGRRGIADGDGHRRRGGVSPGVGGSRADLKDHADGGVPTVAWKTASPGLSETWVKVSPKLSLTWTFMCCGTLSFTLTAVWAVAVLPASSVAVALTVRVTVLMVPSV